MCVWIGDKEFFLEIDPFFCIEIFNQCQWFWAIADFIPSVIFHYISCQIKLAMYRILSYFPLYPAKKVAANKLFVMCSRMQLRPIRPWAPAIWLTSSLFVIVQTMFTYLWHGWCGFVTRSLTDQFMTVLKGIPIYLHQ